MCISDVVLTYGCAPTRTVMQHIHQFTSNNGMCTHLKVEKRIKIKINICFWLMRFRQTLLWDFHIQNSTLCIPLIGILCTTILVLRKFIKHKLWPSYSSAFKCSKEKKKKREMSMDYFNFQILSFNNAGRKILPFNCSYGLRIRIKCTQTHRIDCHCAHTTCAIVVSDYNT